MFKSSPHYHDWRAIYKCRIKWQANDHVRIGQAFEIFLEENIVVLKKNSGNQHGDVVPAVYQNIVHMKFHCARVNDVHVEEKTAERRIYFK